MFAAALLVLLQLPIEPAVAVMVRDDAGATEVLTGRVVLADAGGGVLLESPDGTLHALAATRVVANEETGRPFIPLPAAELGAALAAELGDGAAVTLTPHYAIASTASAEFTAFAAELLEHFRAAFLAEFAPPREPAGALPVLILADRTAFAAYVARPGRVGGVVDPNGRGFYDPVTNRVVLYDFAAGSPAGRVRDTAAAARATVATVVHEAAHQLAYNVGLHARLADNPVWVTEGLAMLCEPADPRHPLGWRGFGRRNAVRFGEFRAFLALRRRDPNLRNANPLPALIRSDDLFRDPATAGHAYAAAWALTAHLRRTRPDALAAYLADLAAKPPLAKDTPDDRAALFAEHFGGDIDALWLRVTRGP